VLLLLLLLALLPLAALAAPSGQCGAADNAEPKYSYGDVFSPERDQGIAFSSECFFFSGRRAHPAAAADAAPPRPPARADADAARPVSPPHPTRADLPGFTRSFYDRDHALITHESRVWLPGLRWCVRARAAPLWRRRRALAPTARAHPSPPLPHPVAALQTTKKTHAQEQLGDVPPDHARAQRALYDVSGAHGQGIVGRAQGTHHGAVRRRRRRRRRRKGAAAARNEGRARWGAPAALTKKKPAFQPRRQQTTASSS